jgi:hypothetical protein
VIYALDESGIKIEAAKGRRGVCPTCGEEMLSRCGTIRIWHWGHVARRECDPWQERESEWHRSWKALAPRERVEVCFGDHRADILGADDCVIELQHSRLSIREIWEREAFYGKMIWLLDGAVLLDRLRVERSGDEVAFSWAHARPSWLAARKPLFVHGFSLGTHINVADKQTRRIERHWREFARSPDVLQLKSLMRRGGVHGAGKIVPIDRFRARMLEF